MRVRIRSKYAYNLTTDEVKQISKLRLNHGMLMHEIRSERDCYKEAKSKEERFKPNVRAFLAEDQNKKIVAWGILYYQIPESKGHSQAMMLYVKRSHRRQGIGTRLVKLMESHSETKRIKCFKHDYISSEFFKSIKSNKLRRID